jgi:hypothetical protein
MSLTHLSLGGNNLIFFANKFYSVEAYAISLFIFTKEGKFCAWKGGFILGIL